MDLVPTTRADALVRSARTDRWRVHGRGAVQAYSPAAVTRDEDTGRLLIDGASGLTCATFVLAILEVASIRLADLSTWAGREGDDVWKAWVVGQLEESGGPAEHVAAVRADKDHVRVRPEDVAGAATEKPVPVAFNSGISRGSEISARARPALDVGVRFTARSRARRRGRRRSFASAAWLLRLAAGAIARRDSAMLRGGLAVVVHDVERGLADDGEARGAVPHLAVHGLEVHDDDAARGVARGLARPRRPSARRGP